MFPFTYFLQKMINITTHSLIKNEQNWIWFSLNSVLEQSSKLLVYDDNSTDNTEAVVSLINSDKIQYKKVEAKTSQDHTKLRNEMVAATKTEWFLVLDGDEVWNNETLRQLLLFLEKQPKNVWAVATRTRNCVGDVYHYQAESAGRYQILGRKGNLSIRAYRKLPGFHWSGDYPLEAWCDQSGIPVNKQNDHLSFFDSYYWHMTFLPRTTAKSSVKGWRKIKFETGIPVENESDLPEVLFSTNKPTIVPNPLVKMPSWKHLLGKVVLLLKNIRR